MSLVLNAFLLIKVKRIERHFPISTHCSGSSGISAQELRGGAGIYMTKEYTSYQDDNGKVELTVACSLCEKEPGSTLILRYRDQSNGQWKTANLTSQPINANPLYYETSIWIDGSKEFDGQIEIFNGEAVKGSSLDSLYRPGYLGTGSITMYYSQQDKSDKVRYMFSAEYRKCKAFEVKEITVTFLSSTSEDKEYKLSSDSENSFIVDKKVHELATSLRIAVKYGDGYILENEWQNKPLSGAIIAKRLGEN